ncbi:hypothetical protein PHET_07868 [Paragonimus heterotremus]|uniref:Uncharacterized protein n=1 Tax=Paragonimus heterotremus TaxID=100268 RepID=A0A8J4WG53_9TREM|nr:hypothetical protein PHET_07868 [Paragonimus heterotremus]
MKTLVDVASRSTHAPWWLASPTPLPDPSQLWGYASIVTDNPEYLQLKFTLTQAVVGKFQNKTVLGTNGREQTDESYLKKLQKALV